MKITQLQEQTNLLTNARADLETRLQQNQDNLRKITAELDDEKTAKTSLEDQLDKKEKELVVLQETYEDMTYQVDHQREKAESIRTQLDSERRTLFDLEQSLSEMKKFMTPDNRVKILFALETNRKLPLRSLTAATGITPIEIKRLITELEDDNYIQMNIHDEIELIKLPWRHETQG